MSIELENQVWHLQTAVEDLLVRVKVLEKKFGKSGPPLKKRVKAALEAAKNDLALARNRAKEADDIEVVEAIEELMSKVG